MMAVLAKPAAYYNGDAALGATAGGTLTEQRIDTGNAAVVVLTFRGASGSATLETTLDNMTSGAGWQSASYSTSLNGATATGPLAFSDGTKVFLLGPISYLRVNGTVASGALTLWYFGTPFVAGGATLMLDGEPVSGINPLPVLADLNGPFPAGENHIGQVGTQILRSYDSFTRPADATAYTAKDVVSNSTSAPRVLEFDNAVRVNGGTGYIVKARLMTDQKTNVWQGRLHLFSEPPAAINDNSPFLLLWADRSIRLGSIDFPLLSSEDPANSTGAEAQVTDERLSVRSAYGKGIYGILENLTAGAIGSAANIYVEIDVEVN